MPRCSHQFRFIYTFMGRRLQNRRESLDRRELLKSALAGTVALGFPSLLRGQSDKLAVIDGGGTNVVAFSSTDGLLLVDSGAPNNGDRIVAALKTFAPNAKVTTL